MLIRCEEWPAAPWQGPDEEEIKTQNSQRKQTEKPDNLIATKADSSICSQHRIK
jgi:hypothetical protein